MVTFRAEVASVVSKGFESFEPVFKDKLSHQRVDYILIYISRELICISHR